LLPEQIDAQMQFILGQEQIAFEPAALKMLGRAADGSLRDGLSLLDQAIVYGSGSVTTDAVIGMLGTVAQQPIDDMLQALAAGDARALLAEIADVAELTPDFADILQQMLRVLHRVALLQQMPDFVDQEFDKQLLDTLDKTLLPEDVQLYYQIGLLGQRDLPLAPDPRSGFEMVMLRMLTFRPQTAEAQTLEPAKSPVVKSVASTPAPVAVVESSAKSIEEPRPLSVSQVVKPSNWTEIIAALNISGRTRELANNCVLDGIDDSSCRLLLDPSFQQVGTKAEDNLRVALQNYYGKPLKLLISKQVEQQMTPALEMQKAREDRQQAAVDSINSDENVQALKDTFGARIMPGSIEPLN